MSFKIVVNNFIDVQLTFRRHLTFPNTEHILSLRLDCNQNG